MKKLLTSLLLITASMSSFAENRIISAGSSITELIMALDARDQLVAIDVTSAKLDKSGSLPQVGYHRQLSAEGLLALNPTHLIGSDAMGPQNTLTHLENAKVKVVTVPSGDTAQDLYKRIDTIAEITGKQKQATALKKELDKKFAHLNSHKVENKPKVIFAMIMPGRPMTIAGNKTTVNEVINLAGAENPAQSMMESYKPLSMEAIVNLQPDYLVVIQHSWDQQGGHEGILKTLPLLKATPAGQQGHIIAIPGSAITGGLGIESIDLAKQLYDTFHPAMK